MRLWGKKGHLMRWRRECPPNPQQVCLFTKHLEIERAACPQIDMQLIRDFVPHAPLSIGEIITLAAPAPSRQPRAASTSNGPLAGEAARVPDGIAKYLKRISFGTRGSQVQILPLRPTFSTRKQMGEPIWGTKLGDRLLERPPSSLR